MSDRKSYPALREIRAHFARPVTLIVLLAIAALLTLLGPFNTGDFLRPAPRFAFWLTHVALNYALGFAIHTAFHAGPAKDWPRGVAFAATGLTTGLLISGAVLVINWAALGHVPEARELPVFVGTVFAIALIVSGVLDLLGHEIGRMTAATPTALETPPILDRLPVDKRGGLVALSAEDHYVRVMTDVGEDLVLMRFGDAINEVGTTPGLRTHRAHWVAAAHVTSAERQGERAILTLTGGREIPVSRSYLPDLRKAGLLPR